jgi:hypothetical protein
MEPRPPGPPASRCWTRPLHSDWLSELLVGAATFEHPIEDWGRGGGLGGQVVCHCILRAWDVSQVQDFEVLFQLTHTEQVSCQLGVVVAALPPDLLYDELGVSFYKEPSNS